MTSVTVNYVKQDKHNFATFRLYCSLLILIVFVNESYRIFMDALIRSQKCCQTQHKLKTKLIQWHDLWLQSFKLKSSESVRSVKINKFVQSDNLIFKTQLSRLLLHERSNKNFSGESLFFRFKRASAAPSSRNYSF